MEDSDKYNYINLNIEQLIKMLTEVSGSKFWEKSSEGYQIRRA